MAIPNKRTAIKKNNLDARLKSKLKENFNWMTEEDELDDSELGVTPEDGNDLDAGLNGGDMGMDAGMGSELPAEDPMGGGMEDLSQSQVQTLDSEVDELLQMNLDSIMNDGSMTDDSLAEDESDMNMDIETPTEDVAGVMGAAPAATEEPMEVIPGINTDELQSIIDAPNSLASLENELVQTVQGEEAEETGADEMFENEDPFKGISDLPGFDQGYEGEDVKDELMEDVELASELKDLEFGAVSEPIGDGVTSTVSDSGIKGGADSNVDTVNDGPQDAPEDYGARQIKVESIKKSKMLVKAAAAILKLKQMQEAAQKEANRLKFENAKLSKVNALLAVAGDKMTKDVRKKMVESFSKCKTAADVNTLYGKVVSVIKEHSKPSLNKIVSSKKTQVNSTNIIKESANKEDVKYEVSRQQMRKNYLMGMNTSEDMYYND